MYSTSGRGRRVAKFYGWRIVGAAFVLAFFGWGLGFYGPPVYLHAVREARGFSIGLVSAAVTVHFLSGAVVAANAPALYHRFGVPMVTIGGGMPARRGRVGLVDRCHAVATFRRDHCERRRLGGDQRCCGKCGRVAMVRAHAAGGTRLGLQRRESSRA